MDGGGVDSLSHSLLSPPTTSNFISPRITPPPIRRMFNPILKGRIRPPRPLAFRPQPIRIHSSLPSHLDR